MGFFSDLREDLSQAGNEMMPAEEQTSGGGKEAAAAEAKGRAPEPAGSPASKTATGRKPAYSLEEMLENIDSFQLDDEEFAETEVPSGSDPEPVQEAGEDPVEELPAEGPVAEEEITEEPPAEAPAAEVRRKEPDAVSTEKQDGKSTAEKASAEEASAAKATSDRSTAETRNP